MDILIAVVVAALIVVGIYFLLNKKKDVVHQVEEVRQSTDIFVKIPINNMVENKSIIIGVEQSFVMFENEALIYNVDDYRVNYKDVLPFMQRGQKNVDMSQNQVKNIYTAFKIQNGVIRDIEISNKNVVQLFDNFYDVLVKCKMNIRISCQIINQEDFLKNLGGFRKQLSHDMFVNVLEKILGSKMYSYLSSFVISKKISYLHTSLYKHEIEDYMIDEFNKELLLLGLSIDSLQLKNIEFDQDAQFKEFEANLLERTRMNILDYSYTDKMNKEVNYHEDISKVYTIDEDELRVKM